MTETIYTSGIWQTPRMHMSCTSRGEGWKQGHGIPGSRGRDGSETEWSRTFWVFSAKAVGTEGAAESEGRSRKGFYRVN